MFMPGVHAECAILVSLYVVSHSVYVIKKCLNLYVLLYIYNGFLMYVKK